MVQLQGKGKGLAEPNLELESPEQAEVRWWVTGKPLSAGEPGHRRPRGLCGTPAAPLSQGGEHTGGLKDGRQVQSTVHSLYTPHSRGSLTGWLGTC